MLVEYDWLVGWHVVGKLGKLLCSGGPKALARARLRGCPFHSGPYMSKLIQRFSSVCNDFIIGKQSLCNRLLGIALWWIFLEVNEYMWIHPWTTVIISELEMAPLCIADHNLRYPVEIARTRQIDYLCGSFAAPYVVSVHRCQIIETFMMFHGPLTIMRLNVPGEFVFKKKAYINWIASVVVMTEPEKTIPCNVPLRTTTN